MTRHLTEKTAPYLVLVVRDGIEREAIPVGSVAAAMLELEQQQATSPDDSFYVVTNPAPHVSIL